MQPTSYTTTAPAGYQKPDRHPLYQAVSDAEERQWNAIRSGDQAAITAAALHLHHCKQKAAEKTKADMRKHYDQLTLDERHQQWRDSMSETRPTTL